MQRFLDQRQNFRQLANDKEGMLQAAKQNYYALRYAHPDLKTDKAFMLKVIRTAGVRNLTHINIFWGGNLLHDKEFMLAAARIDISALQYATVFLKENERFVREALAINPRAKDYVDPETYLSVTGDQKM